MTFRKSLSIQPHQGIAQLQPGILDRDAHPVIGPAPAKREQVRAGLHGAHERAPERNSWDALVPGFPHEAETIGRIGHDGADAFGVKLRRDFQRIAAIERDAGAAVVRRPLHCTPSAAASIAATSSDVMARFSIRYHALPGGFFRSICRTMSSACDSAGVPIRTSGTCVRTK